MTIEKDVELTEAQRLAIIANAVRAVQGVEVEGLALVTKEDVLDEAQNLDALDREEGDDFDGDENAVNMDTLSPAMRAVFS